jgi:hypothetical protein
MLVSNDDIRQKQTSCTRGDNDIMAVYRGGLKRLDGEEGSGVKWVGTKGSKVEIGCEPL